MPSDMSPESDMPGDMPGDMPSDMPSDMPTSLTFERLPGSFATCCLCGEYGRVEAEPDKIFAYPGAETPITCGKKAEDGLAGLIEEEECKDLQTYVKVYCGGCIDEA
jgi:hypothetical protein